MRGKGCFENKIIPAIKAAELLQYCNKMRTLRISFAIILCNYFLYLFKSLS